MPAWPPATALGLIDEYRARVYPVLVDGGIPFFPKHERRVDLELMHTSPQHAKPGRLWSVHSVGHKNLKKAAK
jgi:dihydrofolate reductase